MSQPSPMTIMELLRAYPTMFKMSQDWYWRDGWHRFTRAMPVNIPDVPPSRLTRRGKKPSKLHPAYWSAAELLNCYVRHPDAACWNWHMHTKDVDDYGYTVYVGLKSNGHGVEIHRLLLPLTGDFGIPA